MRLEGIRWTADIVSSSNATIAPEAAELTNCRRNARRLDGTRNTEEKPFQLFSFVRCSYPHKINCAESRPSFTLGLLAGNVELHTGKTSYSLKPTVDNNVVLNRTPL